VLRKGNGPGGNRPSPRDLAHSHQRTCTLDERLLAHPRTPTEEKLAKLEERLAHELMDDEERQELRDRVLALRRHLSR
jgi:hypothetical protein